MELLQKKISVELKKNPNAKVFAEYILEECATNPNLIAKVMQKDKTLRGLMLYIRDKAKNKAKDNFACIDHTTVFKWVSLYYGGDGKISRNSLQAAERSVRNGAPIKFEEKESKEKSNKKSNIDGQMDIFAMLGGDS